MGAGALRALICAAFRSEAGLRSRPRQGVPGPPCAHAVFARMMLQSPNADDFNGDVHCIVPSKADVGCGCDRFGRVSLNVAGIGPAGVDLQVAALAPSQLAECLCERGVPGLSLGIVRGEIREHADAPQPLALLRVRRERPRGRAAEQPNERAASCMSGKEHCEG